MRRTIGPNYDKFIPKSNMRRVVPTHLPSIFNHGTRCGLAIYVRKCMHIIIRKIFEVKISQETVNLIHYLN